VVKWEAADQPEINQENQTGTKHHIDDRENGEQDHVHVKNQEKVFVFLLVYEIAAVRHGGPHSIAPDGDRNQEHSVGHIREEEHAAFPPKGLSRGGVVEGESDCERCVCEGSAAGDEEGPQICPYDKPPDPVLVRAG
jgi:hypothetical protein